MKTTMDKTTFFFWDTIALNITWAGILGMICSKLADFVQRLTLAVIVSIAFVMLDATLRYKTGRKVFGGARGALQRFLKVVLRAVLVASSMTALISFAMSGNATFVYIEDGYTHVNNTYALVVLVTWLGITLLVSALTSI